MVVPKKVDDFREDHASLGSVAIVESGRKELLGWTGDQAARL